jgi:hypothetical protein
MLLGQILEPVRYKADFLFLLPFALLLPLVGFILPLFALFEEVFSLWVAVAALEGSTFFC